MRFRHVKPEGWESTSCQWCECAAVAVSQEGGRIVEAVCEWHYAYAAGDVCGRCGVVKAAALAEGVER